MFVKWCTTKVGDSAIHMAAFEGKLEAIQCLVKHKADPNLPEKVFIPHIETFPCIMTRNLAIKAGNESLSFSVALTWHLVTRPQL